MKIAFLTNYTTDFIVKEFQKKLKAENIEAELYLPGFNQYVQEIINDKSGLYNFKPEVIYFSLDVAYYCEDILSQLFDLGSQKCYEQIEERMMNVYGLLNQLSKSLPNSVVMIENYFLKSSYFTKTLEYNSNFGLENIILKLNSDLERFILESQNFRIMSLTSLFQQFGEEKLIDQRLHYIAKSRWSQFGNQKIAELYINHLRAYKGLRKKCIVLDLDNTLWGGVIGQDGMEGILLSNDGPGKAFYDFQTELLKLFKMGILLVIASKNTEEVAMEAIEKHPYMVLRKNNFVAHRINWDNKAQNIRSMAQELNIGLDSFIFLDDSHFERGLVAAEIPEVIVPALPEDPMEYVKFLKSLDFFNFHKLTADDFKRNKTYLDNQERKKFSDAFTDTTAYLKSLEMTALIKPIDDFSFPRIVQLIGKTNQFNVTTRRHSESVMKEFYGDSNNYLILELSLKDKFGDNGIVAAAIVKFDESESALIDTLLMSCRVISRNVENAFISFMGERVKEKGKKFLVGEIIPTAKNEPCREVFANNGFQSEANGFWRFDLSASSIPSPDYIKIVTTKEEYE